MCEIGRHPVGVDIGHPRRTQRQRQPFHHRQPKVKKKKPSPKQCIIFRVNKQRVVCVVRPMVYNNKNGAYGMIFNRGQVRVASVDIWSNYRNALIAQQQSSRVTPSQKKLTCDGNWTTTKHKRMAKKVFTSLTFPETRCPTTSDDELSDLFLFFSKKLIILICRWCEIRGGRNSHPRNYPCTRTRDSKAS